MNIDTNPVGMTLFEAFPFIPKKFREKAFIKELEAKGLPTDLERITCDCAGAWDKRIILRGWGSSSKDYELADFEQVKQLIESSHPGYKVTKG